MVKEGKRFRDKETGKRYVVRWVDKDDVILFGADGTGKKLKSESSLNVTYEKLGQKPA